MPELLLDTSAAIAFMRREKEIEDRVWSAERSYLSAVVLGELLIGLHRCMDPEMEAERVARLCQVAKVLPVTAQTAEHYAVLGAELKRKNRSIPSNDLWIAASAVEHGLTLAARDEHFSALESLRWERW